jgi:transcriptional regulator with XRE-family HTH domain
MKKHQKGSVHMDNELLVKSIREICKVNNITPSQLENELNFGAGLISRWTKSSPSLDKIVDIADYFHISIDKLIGRNYDADDSFLKIVDRQTFKHILKWNILDDNINQNISKPIMYGEVTDTENKTHTYYNQSIYNEYFCYTSYNEGFIIIGAVCAKHELNKPQYISLYIQPTEKSEAIRQDYIKEQLESLWIKVLKSLSDKTPSEILVEDFKQQMLAGEEVDLLKYCQEFIEQTPDNKNDINKLLKDEKAKEVLIKANDPAVQQLISTFSNPKVIQTIDSTNRLVKYMMEIDKLRNKKDKQN